MGALFLKISLWVSFLLQKRKQKRDLFRLSSFLDAELSAIESMPPAGVAQQGTLIVKCDDIGDFLIWQAVIPQITRHAERPITLVANSVVRPLLETWFDFADQYIWVDKSAWDNEVYRRSLYEQVRRLSPALAFTPLFTRNFRMDDLLLRASDASRRVVWDRSLHPYFPGLASADRMGTENISSHRVPELEYFRNMEFVDKLYGIQTERIFKPLFPDFSKQNRLVVFPAANTRSRWWDSRHYASVIRAVAPRFDSILLLGGSNALDYCRRIEEEAAEPKLINLCAQTALTELMAFIGESKVLLCPDTSALHFGVLTATDTVVLSNGNNWQRFAGYAPYVSSRFTLLFPPYFTPRADQIKIYYSSKEIQSIPEEQVIRAILLSAD